jgi:hypothetical protein
MKFILHIMVGVSLGAMLIDTEVGLSLAVIFFMGWLAFGAVFVGWLAFRTFERFRCAVMTERPLAEGDAAELIKTAIAQGKEIVMPYRVKGEIERESVKIIGFDAREIRAVEALSNECRSYSWNRVDTDLLIAALAGSLFTPHAPPCTSPKPKLHALSLAKRREARARGAKFKDAPALSVEACAETSEPRVACDSTPASEAAAWPSMFANFALPEFLPIPGANGAPKIALQR